MDLPGLIQQELQSQYINPTKLSKLLAELFPGVQTVVEFQEDDVVIIHVPRKLTKEEIARAFDEVTK
ncbi:hypothetical protein BGZ60DRAFT_424866 [Tricladium varicosporioides]|nr:hypothetical protein BGZ60DRAFT_424866 [Hymenoscyphus varicosporioides]